VRRFVIAATSRSGTRFISRALAQAGVRCGHEEVFGIKPCGFHGWGEFDGDASWLSVPFLSELPRDALLFHQVREPLPTIRSIASTGIFRPFDPRYRMHEAVCTALRRRVSRWPVAPYRRFARTYSAYAWKRSGEFARAAQHWVDWNLRIERDTERYGLSYERVRVEDLDAAGVVRMAVRITGEVCTAAALQLDSSVNARGRRYDHAFLGDLPAELAEEVVALAQRYGYNKVDSC
jgi:hypothetical protein